MRLVDLDPRWLMRGDTRIGLVFQCPHCRKCYLSCFFECTPVMTGEWADEAHEARLPSQYDAINAVLGEAEGMNTVPCRKDFAWKVEPSAQNAFFETLSITPSLDATASGHWHGFVTKGEIVGGAQLQGDL